MTNEAAGHAGAGRRRGPLVILRHRPWVVAVPMILALAVAAWLAPSEDPMRVATVPRAVPVPAPVTISPERTTTTAAARRDAWREMASSPLRGFPAIGPIWTDKELLVWAEVAGMASPPFGGAAYDPAADRWRRIAASPLAGSDSWRMSAVWTGIEVLVWGAVVVPPSDGYANARQVQPHTAGARYNPETNTWLPMSPSPLSSRFWHEAVWTGKEMIVWGGANADNEDQLDGAAFNPVTDTWRSIARGPFTTSVGKAAVWTGDRLIVWGGCRRSDEAGEGGIYDPATDRWEAIPAAPVTGRHLDSRAFWTGEEFLFWSGRGGPSEADRCEGQYAGYLDDGAAYNPATGKWRLLPPSPAPQLEYDPRVHLWTGEELLVFAGKWQQDGKGPTRGAAYEPATDRWRLLSAHPLVARLWPYAVWTESEMLLWGPENLSGWGDVSPVAGDDFGAIYRPR